MSDLASIDEFDQQYENEKKVVLAALARFREGVHYLRGEEGRPVLMDAGAALLRDALGLYPGGDRIVDFRQEAGGHLRVIITVDLYERQSGRPRASGIGSASSRELLAAGRLAEGLDPGNAAAKLARKRAEVDAMLGIPAVREQFSQDLGLMPAIDPATGEVYEVPAPRGEEGQPSAAEGGSPQEEGAAAFPPDPGEGAQGVSPPSGDSRPTAPARRLPSPEMAAQRQAFALAQQADRRNPYGWIVRTLGIPVEGVSPAVALLRWLDQGHSWQEVAARLQEAASGQNR